MFQDNQTYVDDLKDLTGVPMHFFQAMRVWLGEDWKFWLLPTQPILTINYCERLFCVKELMRTGYKREKTIEYDPQSKLKAVAQQQAKQDRIYFTVATCCVFATCFCLPKLF